MRLDKVKKWSDFRDEVVAISRANVVPQTPDSDGHWSSGNLARVTRERKVLTNVTIKLSKHVHDAETRIPLL